MAEGRGGYRRPSDPAPVSPPGANSRRTDGNATQAGRDLPDPKYGEQQDFQEIQGGAPMAAQAPPPGFNDPTQYPDEPITSGAQSGPGVGPEAAGIEMDPVRGDAHNMRASLYSMEMAANQPGSNPTMRMLVRLLKSKLPA